MEQSDLQIIKDTFNSPSREGSRSRPQYTLVIVLTVFLTITIVEVAHSHFKWRDVPDEALLSNQSVLMSRLMNM